MPYPYPWSGDIEIDPASVPSPVYAIKDANGNGVLLEVGGSLFIVLVYPSDSDVETINSAIQSVSDAGGGEVRLKAGTYWLKNKGADAGNKGAIQLLSGVKIVGDGLSSTIIKCHADLIKDTPMIRSMNASYIGVVGVKLDGNRTNRPTVIADDQAEDEGISFVDCTNTYIADCEITDVGQEAVDTDDCDMQIFERNYIHDVWGNAYHMAGSAGSTNTTVRDFVIDNVAHGRGASALTLASAFSVVGKNVSIENGTIIDSYRGIYHTQNATNSSINKVIFTNNTREDIFSENMSNSGLSVRDCEVTKTTDYYAVDLRSAKASFTNVKITSSSTTTDVINTTPGSAGSEFNNCKITGGRIGLLLFGTNFVVNNGQYSGAATDGIQMFGSGSYATLTNVTMSGGNSGFNISDAGAWAYLYGCIFPSSKCRIRNSSTTYIGAPPGTMEFASGGTPTVIELTNRALGIRSPNNTRYLLTVSDAGVLGVAAG